MRVEECEEVGGANRLCFLPAHGEADDTSALKRLGYLEGTYKERGQWVPPVDRDS